MARSLTAACGQGPIRERQYNEWCEMPAENFEMWNVVEEILVCPKTVNAANSGNRIRARIVQSARRVIEGHVSVCEPGIWNQPSVQPHLPRYVLPLLLRQ